MQDWIEATVVKIALKILRCLHNELLSLYYSNLYLSAQVEVIIKNARVDVHIRKMLNMQFHIWKLWKKCLSCNFFYLFLKVILIWLKIETMQTGGSFDYKHATLATKKLSQKKSYHTISYMKFVCYAFFHLKSANMRLIFSLF